MRTRRRPRFPGRALAVLERSSERLASANPLEKHIGKRGGRVVDANLDLVRAAYQELIDVTARLRDARHEIRKMAKEAA